GRNTSVREFWEATRLQRPAMENLVMLGAFDSVAHGKARRELLWELRESEDSLGPRAVPTEPSSAGERRASSREGKKVAPPRGRGLATRRARPLPEKLQPTLLDAPAPAPPLPDLTERERVAAEYRLSEVSTGPHLMSFLRKQLDSLGCTPLAGAHTIADRQRARVAGLVIVRQAPSSASGFRFFTLADETGHLDLVLRPRVYQRVRNVANFHPLLLVDGVIEAENGRLNLLVEQVRALDGNGRVIPDARARHGGGASRDAPRQQHGHITPPADELPSSHYYR